MSISNSPHAADAAILIVDSKWDSVGSVYEATEDLGVNLYWATTAEEACGILRRVAVDVLVLNAEIRAGDGRTLFEIVRSEPLWNRTYIVALLPQENLRERIRNLEHGVDDFLVKPVEPFLLRARIMVALRVKFLLREKQRLEDNEAYMATVVTVAHQINNPLCAIIGNAVLLREELSVLDGSVDHSVEECIETIERQSERIAEFLRRLQSLKNPSLTHYLGDMQMVALPEEKLGKSR